MRVYISSWPYEPRVRRDSPPDEARACAAPTASSSNTRCPDLRRCQAVQAPNTPAPTTMESQAGLPAALLMCVPAKLAASVVPIAARRVMRLLMHRWCRGPAPFARKWGLTPLRVAAGCAFLHGRLHGPIAAAECFLGCSALESARAVQCLHERDHVAQLGARQYLPIDFGHGR